MTFNLLEHIINHNFIVERSKREKRLNNYLNQQCENVTESQIEPETFPLEMRWAQPEPVSPGTRLTQFLCKSSGSGRARIKKFPLFYFS